MTKAKRRPPSMWKIRGIAYLTGWDSALISPEIVPACKYTRPDYRERWREGRADCLANKPLPSWVYGGRRAP